MAFTNRIRLPFKLHKPQFQEEVEKYRKANGVTVVLSSVVRKIYEGITDEFPEKIHERLKIALRHDSVHVEGDRYVGLITQEGDYAIEWSEFLSRPIAQAKFKAEVTPYNASNSNCGTCETYTQVVAEDDNIGAINEGDTFNVDVLANDSICCNPVTVTVTSFDSLFVLSATVQPDNTIDVVMQNPAPSANGVVLLTYRATCDNGLYDEANMIADVTGTGEACLAPTGLTIDDVTDDSVTISWTQPLGALSYEWLLYLQSDLGTVIQFGTATIIDNSVTISSLIPSTQYRFYIKSICADDDESNLVYIDFITDPATGDPFCGHYRLTNNNFFGYENVSYTDCNGVVQNLIIPSLQVREICALQTAPGSPVDITANGSVGIEYLGLC